MKVFENNNKIIRNLKFGKYDSEEDEAKTKAKVEEEKKEDMPHKKHQKQYKSKFVNI